MDRRTVQELTRTIFETDYAPNAVLMEHSPDNVSFLSRLSLFSHLLPQVCCGTESLSVGRSRLEV